MKSWYVEDYDRSEYHFTIFFLVMFQTKLKGSFTVFVIIWTKIELTALHNYVGF